MYTIYTYMYIYEQNVDVSPKNCYVHLLFLYAIL